VTTNKDSFQTFGLWFPDYCALVVPVMMVMMVVGIKSVVMPVIVRIVAIVMMIAIPGCGWNRATGHDCANNA
jgi:hypothetical protein